MSFPHYFAIHGWNHLTSKTFDHMQQNTFDQTNLCANCEIGNNFAQDKRTSTFLELQLTTRAGIGMFPCF